MRMMKKLTTFCVVLTMILSLAGTALAKEEYTYTIRVYAGNQGTIDGAEYWEQSGLHYGDRVYFDVATVSVNDPSKYYVRGIKESGEDNDNLCAAAFVVNGDMDYSVAYGVYGNRATIIVKYVDETGKDLLDPTTFYANEGDKPIIAYRYIENMQPQAYNLTRTLKSGENVFTFVYQPIPEETPAEDDDSSSDEEESTDNSSDSNAEDSNTEDSSNTDDTSDQEDSSSSEEQTSDETQEGSEDSASEGSEDGPSEDGPSEGPAQPEEIIDEDEPPMAGFDDSSNGTAESSSGNGISVGAWIGIGAGAGILLLILILVLLKRKKHE